MEHPSTRIPQPKSRRTAPLPTPRAAAAARGEAAAETATVYRAQPRRRPPGIAALQRMPGPRLTGLGCGLLSTLVMLAVGAVDRIVLDSSPVVYGLFFLPLCAAGGMWVRPSDLVTAPISAPIAFTAGLLPLSAGKSGGELMGVFTTLALQAGWLYGGTLVAGLVVILRKALLMAEAAASRQA